MSYFKSGSWNVICQICGRQVKSDEVRKRWDGLLVCASDFEHRHSLDFIRVPEEHSIVPFTSPEPTDQFLYICYLQASQGLADVSEADCARADIQLKIEF